MPNVEKPFSDYYFWKCLSVETKVSRNISSDKTKYQNLDDVIILLVRLLFECLQPRPQTFCVVTEHVELVIFLLHMPSSGILA